MFAYESTQQLLLRLQTNELVRKVLVYRLEGRSYLREVFHFRVPDVVPSTISATTQRRLHILHLRLHLSDLVLHVPQLRGEVRHRTEFEICPRSKKRKTPFPDTPAKRLPSSSADLHNTPGTSEATEAKAAAAQGARERCRRRCDYLVDCLNGRKT